MQNLLNHQHAALESWAKRAIESGWLSSSDLTALDNTVIASPAALFSISERPLVVGFFGGTGVGKSTLLNRFAEEEVAEASAIRPTSQHITVYVHESVTVENLPSGFPVEKMHTAAHSNDAFRQVIFVDMPDFDSVETSHRVQVSQWLPHIDVVLYVVSPERYRDDQGWRLLLENAQQHAWVFVMNQWDRGDKVQLEDFTQQLAGAGLQEPLVFCTDSANAPVDDDFVKLRDTILASADQAIIEALNEHGIIARLQGLKGVGDQWLEKLTPFDVARDQPTRWAEHCVNQLPKIIGYQHAKTLSYAKTFESQDKGLLAFFQKRKSEIALPTDIDPIDDNLIQRFDYLLQDYIHQQHEVLGIPISAINRAVEERYQAGRLAITSIVTEKLGESLAHPGQPWQRGLHQCLGGLSIGLPVLSMVWIAWRVISGFTEGATDTTAYLGINFTINATLLVGLSWLIPSFLHYKTRPSLPKAAAFGIEDGIRQALEDIQQKVSLGLTDLANNAKQLRESYIQLWSQLENPTLQTLPRDVKRMLAADNSDASHRSLDVRATTQSATDAAPAS